MKTTLENMEQEALKHYQRSLKEFTDDINDTSEQKREFLAYDSGYLAGVRAAISIMKGNN